MNQGLCWSRAWLGVTFRRILDAKLGLRVNDSGDCGFEIRVRPPRGPDPFEDALQVRLNLGRTFLEVALHSLIDQVIDGLLQHLTKQG